MRKSRSDSSALEMIATEVIREARKRLFSMTNRDSGGMTAKVPAMRLSSLLSVFVVLCPSGLFATGPLASAQTPVHVPVRVTANIPLIAAVDGPDQVVLAPGEVAHIHVCVLANIPWTLRIHSPNTCALASAPLNGPPGGKTANTRDVDIACSPQAPGPQVIDLVYTLMER
jgi:hypothetical protein